MKKNTVSILACIMVALLVVSCRMVEVSSKSRTFAITILTDLPSHYQLSQLKASGQFEAAQPVAPGAYSISIPSMDGGYAEFICIKYNRHIPEEYPVIRVLKRGR